MIRETEQQMVQLALAVARRIVHREITLDPDLLIAMARVALDRLGDSAHVTIRLHPEDYTAMRRRPRHGVGRHRTSRVVADSRVARGGCRVESDFGAMDAGVDAQIHELARALLGDDESVARALSQRLTAFSLARYITAVGGIETMPLTAGSSASSAC